MIDERLRSLVSGLLIQSGMYTDERSHRLAALLDVEFARVAAEAEERGAQRMHGLIYVLHDMSVQREQATEAHAARGEENKRLRAALEMCRDALRTVASCHACELGITLGFANHCVDCEADTEAKENEVDLDKVVQGAWESARNALAPEQTEKP